ncbi:MAG: response regulator, partial [Acidimicrobiia bacterium]|nr:response regulator [Acidimicrobiia bacterium]MDX2465798.1 response regulator [Acidimicrobiia bacterium]
VVVVSAVADQGRRQALGESLNVLDWIKKPIEADRLRSTLDIALHDGCKPRVLHVEDNPDMLQVVFAILDDMATVTQATSIRDARTLLAGETFDLVLLDLDLADGKGTDLLPEIGADCPVVIFSGTEIAVEDGRKITASLRKAATSNQELIRTIKRVLNGPRARGTDTSPANLD